MKMTRQTVSQKVDFDRYELDGKLTRVISKLQSVLESIPEEFRETAEMDVNGYDEYGSVYVHVEISYRRPETDEELEKRREEQKARAAADSARERAEFERLKAKFG